MIDPDQLTITEKKTMGLWPPQDSMAVTIAPYIRRMRGDDVDVLDIGVGAGENLAYLDENVENIVRFYGLSHDNKYEDLLLKNLDHIKRVDRTYNAQEVAVVLVNMTPETTPGLLAQYYSKVKKGGYFVGDNHDQPYVKEALSKFRRESKIGTPIQVAKTTWFWIKS